MMMARQTLGRLVEQQQTRVENQRVADCQHLLFAARQLASHVAALLLAHIPTAEAETARSGLIFEGQGQARLHLKSMTHGPTNGVQFSEIVMTSCHNLFVPTAAGVATGRRLSTVSLMRKRTHA